MSNFDCPYCSRRASVDLTGEESHSFGLVVCDSCAGYVAREGGEWHAVSYDQLAEIAARMPSLVEQVEAQRVELVQTWVSEEALPPTIFAAVLMQVVREKGLDVLRYKRTPR